MKPLNPVGSRRAFLKGSSASGCLAGKIQQN
ncbi:MAG TPA: hypothetical protein DDZ88_05650 [Verrucomicrobiales bacterium]|nr:hypothetical protein [Verrucomicrobiales bacterium]